MAAVTQPVGSRLPQITTEHAVREWLDALSVGTCEPAEFLHAMQDRFQSDKDGNWEVLSLLDQYYRRGKIKTDVFQTIKASLAGSALGAAQAEAPRRQPRPSSIVTAPVRAKTTAPPKTPPASAPAPRELKIGDFLRQRYRILSVVGQGGMGTVFEASDEFSADTFTASPHIAIKVLHTEVTKRAELLSGLQREFQHLKLLSHPNIVRVHEFDRDGTLAFFTMELLTGVHLGRVFAVRKNVRFDRPRSWSIIRDVGGALAHAHSRNVIHGDMNPQNIFITRDGEVRVLDFGASHRSAGESWSAPTESELESFATPGYASCEVLEGQMPGIQDDIFSFSCVIYLLLTGRHPFDGGSSLEARATKRRPRRPDGINSPQWRALKAGLNLRRDKRPADTQRWMERFGLASLPVLNLDVSSLLEPPRPRGIHLGRPAAIAVLVLALIGAGYWVATNHEAADYAVTGGNNAVAAWNNTVAFVEQWAGKARPSAPLPSIKAPAPDALDDQPEQPPTYVAKSAPRPASPNVPAVVATVAASAPPPAVAHAPQAAAPAAAAPAAVTPAAATPPPGSVHPTAGWPARIEMAEDAVDVPQSDAAAQVTVRRKSNLHGEATFSWWTESGTAKPGTDFSAMAPHVEHIADGKSGTVLTIPLTPNLRSKQKSFYVVIDQNEPGTLLGGKTLTMVTLLPGNQ